MTTQQEAHVERLIGFFAAQLREKYRKGVEEHGGDLQDKEALWLLDEAIMENIDQFTYLLTLREKLRGGK